MVQRNGSYLVLLLVFFWVVGFGVKLMNLERVDD